MNIWKKQRFGMKNLLNTKYLHIYSYHNINLDDLAFIFM